MALASWNLTSLAFKGLLSASHDQRLFSAAQPTPNLILPRHCLSRSVLAFSRRRKSNSPVQSSKKNKKSSPHNNAEEDADLDEDAFEALFNQLEEDLKNDSPSIDDNDEEISEEDLARLERELEEALGDDDELLGMFNSITDEIESNNDAEEVGAEEEEEEEDEEEEEEEEEDDDEDEERPVKLKNWQLRRLASALKTGRRKTSIKSLAAELCLDRAVVLELLREPPPNLLLMSAALPDKPVPTITVPETEPVEAVPLDTTRGAVEAAEPAEPEVKGKVPVHVMQSRWSAQKRLKKVQVETLERVYRRTKRPTNAMISSIVHVTNLPRKRVVKWFEDKRTEDGVPEHRLPFQRSTSETVFSP